MNTTSITPSRGFTLVEMVVSLAIFSVVAVVALGAVVNVISANQKAQSLQLSITNLSFALEAVSRELRVGTSFFCDPSRKNYDGRNGQTHSFSTQGCDIRHGKSSNSGKTIIAFKSSRSGVNADGTLCNLATAYRFVNQTTSLNPKFLFQRAQQTACTSPIIDTDDFNDNTGFDLVYPDLIDPTNITITDYRLGVGPYDASQPGQVSGPYPRVFLRLIGYAGIREAEKTFFDIQTTVSSRLPK